MSLSHETDGKAKSPMKDSSETEEKESEVLIVTGGDTDSNETLDQIKKLQEEQHAISTQLSEMSKMMQNEFTKIDQKVDAVCSSVSEASSILNELLSGTHDCPKLYVVVPIPRATSLVGHKDAVSGWYEAVNNLFHDPNLLLCDSHSVRLYPLCAYSMEPVGNGVEILHPSKSLQELSFALQIGAAVLSSVALSTYPLAALIPGMDQSVQSSLRYVTALKTSLSISQCAGEVASNDENFLSLDSAQQQVFDALEARGKETNGQQPMSSALQNIDKDVLRQVQPLANASYTKVRQLLTQADPDLHALRGLMCPSRNKHSGEIQWVKICHREDWENAQLTATSGGDGAAIASSGGRWVGHTESVHVCTDTSSTTTTTTTANTSDSTISATTSTTQSQQTSTETTIPVVVYDPWVVVAHPEVSSADCEDVQAMAEWLHHGPAHLRASVAESLAVALVLDNCAHMDRLVHRLAGNKSYLLDKGIVSSEDDADVKRALQTYVSQTASAGGSGVSGRQWCVVS